MKLAQPIRFTKDTAHYVLSWLTSPQTAYSIGEPFFWMTGRRGKGWEIDLSQAKRVLVVRLDEIGDVVMTTPFLRELRRNLPDAWITLVVKPAVYNLMEFCPYVNEILTYDWNTRGRLWKLRRHGRALALAWKHLWRRRFDLAILPRWDADYYHGTFVAYFSGAPWRVGYSESAIAHKKRLNGGFDRLLTHTLQDNTIKHEVEHNLEVIRFLGGQVEDDRLELWLSKDDMVFAERFLREYGAKPHDLLVALAPGAGESKRLWPIDRFTEIGSWLLNTYKARLLVIGGRGEESLGEELQQALGDSVVNAVGRTTLRQTAALLKHCRLFVGNDAGPMHMAAAVGVPVIEISCHPIEGSPWHPNSPKRFSPWSVPYRVLQPKRALGPCVDACIANKPHCILSISIDQVKQAVSEHLLWQGIKPRIKESSQKFNIHNSA